MTKLIIRWCKTEYIGTGEFDEDGDEIKTTKRTTHHETFELNDILEMTTSWGYVEIICTVPWQLPRCALRTDRTASAEQQRGRSDRTRR